MYKEQHSTLFQKQSSYPCSILRKTNKFYRWKIGKMMRDLSHSKFKKKKGMDYKNDHHTEKKVFFSFSLVKE